MTGCDLRKARVRAGRRAGFGVVAVIAALPGWLLAQGLAPAEVLDYAGKTVVVFNRNQPESAALAQFYGGARGVPASQLVGLDCAEAETIGRGEFASSVRDPLRRLFDERGWWEVRDLGEGKGQQAVENKIRVLVVVRGVPLRISEHQKRPAVDPITKQRPPAPPVPQGQQNQASVDSELAVLGAFDAPITGPVRNPYFQQNVAFDRAKMPAFFIVGRIDGPSDAVARRLVTDAIETERTGLWGRVYIDLAQKSGGGYAQGEGWLTNSARVFAQNGFPVMIDSHQAVLPSFFPMNDAAVYLGWYATGVSGPFENPAFRFRRGAVACHIHSFSAATLRHAGAHWVAPMLQDGACAVLGNVWEPYLSMTAHLDLFNTRLLQGYTFGEAAAMASPAVSWMTTAVGDPLYRPFGAIGKTITDNTSDADYKALRIATIRWRDPSERDELVANLARAAEQLGSGMLFETLGLMSIQPGNYDASRAFFDRAATAYAAKSDQLRVRLHEVDILRSEGETAGAVAKLRELHSQFGDIPEVAAVDTLLLQLNPPAPPAPGTPPIKEAGAPAAPPETSPDLGNPERSGESDAGTAGGEENRRFGRFNRPGRR